MSTYYLEPSVGNDGNSGNAWGAGNAWATLQHAADTAVAGDRVYCAGTETLSAKVDFDTNSGTVGGGAFGRILFVGCNSSTHAVDGSRYVIDANSVAANCIEITVDYTQIENFEFKNATGVGCNFAAGADRHLLLNCISHNNGDNGFGGSTDESFFIRCRAYSNGGNGFNTVYRCFIAYCASYLNSDSGFKNSLTSIMYACVSHDNGSDAGDCGTDAGELLDDLKEDCSGYVLDENYLVMGFVEFASNNGMAYPGGFYSIVAHNAPWFNFDDELVVTHEISHNLGFWDDYWFGHDRCYMEYFSLFIFSYLGLFYEPQWCDECYNIINDSIWQ